MSSVIFNYHAVIIIEYFLLEILFDLGFHQMLKLVIVFFIIWLLLCLWLYFNFVLDFHYFGFFFFYYFYLFPIFVNLGFNLNIIKVTIRLLYQFLYLVTSLWISGYFVYCIISRVYYRHIWTQKLLCINLLRNQLIFTLWNPQPRNLRIIAFK